MGFEIDVKSIDDIQKMLKDLEESEDPTTFNEWANRIANTAKQICNDPDCKRIKIIETIKVKLISSLQIKKQLTVLSNQYKDY